MATVARAQAVVAHLALDTARSYAIAAGTDSLLEDLPEYGFMEGLPVLRGE